MRVTHTTQPASCSYGGVFDLLPLLAAVERGRMALPLQLSGVASTIQVAGSHFQMP